jgi:phospholipid transport system substrate-binding protein
MHKILKTTCLVLALPLITGIATPVSCWAQSAPQVTSTAKPDQALQVPAGKFIQDLGDQTISVIADKSISQEQRTKKYEDLLRSAFDLQTIGHFVIGRAWNTATPEQQQEYMKLFEQLVIKIYGDRLNFYSGESFHVKSVHQEDKDIVVGSEIDHPGGAQPTLVDWRVRQNGSKLAIVDVIIAGVSQSVTQRQEYSSIIQRDGGKIDGLLDVMRQRVQEPSSSNNKNQ